MENTKASPNNYSRKRGPVFLWVFDELAIDCGCAIRSHSHFDPASANLSKSSTDPASIPSIARLISGPAIEPYELGPWFSR